MGCQIVLSWLQGIPVCCVLLGSVPARPKNQSCLDSRELSVCLSRHKGIPVRCVLLGSVLFVRRKIRFVVSCMQLLRSECILPISSNLAPRDSFRSSARSFFSGLRLSSNFDSSRYALLSHSDLGPTFFSSFFLGFSVGVSNSHSLCVVLIGRSFSSLFKIR